MEKRIMILDFEGKYKFFRVNKDLLEEVSGVVHTLIDEYEKTAPPMKLEEYVTNGLNTIYTSNEVEENKLGLVNKRVAVI